jgi:hypothetical protein
MDHASPESLAVGKAALEAAIKRHGFESPEAFARAFMADFPNAFEDSFSSRDIESSMSTNGAPGPVLKVIIESALACGGYGVDVSDAVAASLSGGDVNFGTMKAMLDSMAPAQRYMGATWSDSA